MIQPLRLPERLMGADPDFFIEKKLSKTEQGLSFFGQEALAEYKRCFRNPETIHAMCEDYRATSASTSTWTPRTSRPAARSTCPVLLLWGATGGVGRNHESMEIWPRYAADIRGGQGAALRALPLRGGAGGDLFASCASSSG